jgi:hypothetical protein
MGCRQGVRADVVGNVGVLGDHPGDQSETDDAAAKMMSYDALVSARTRR